MIIETLSESRLHRYGLKSLPEKEVLARYRWNLALSEAFYPALSLMEVALRNNIDRALSGLTDDYLDENWLGWVSTPWMISKGLPNPEQDALIKTKQKLARTAPHYTRGKLVAELNFGFWAGLFKSYYHPKLWINRHKPLHKVFPGDTSLKALTVYKRLDTIRLLRNRIAHHEAIFERKNLVVEHRSIMTLIRAMDEETYAMAVSLDRFHTLYAQGPAFDQ